MQTKSASRVLETGDLAGTRPKPSRMRMRPGLLRWVAASLAGLAACAHAERDRQAADRLVAELAIAPGLHVADVGAGQGVIALRLAEATGAAGKVYAVELDEARLATLRERAADARYGNLEVVRATEHDPQLPGRVDVVVLRHVYHHLTERVAYARRLKGYLAKDARVAIVEMDELPWYYFHAAHQTTPQVIRSEMEAAGFALVRSSRHEYDNLLVFEVSPASLE